MDRESVGKSINQRNKRSSYLRRKIMARASKQWAIPQSFLRHLKFTIYNQCSTIKPSQNPNAIENHKKVIFFVKSVSVSSSRQGSGSGRHDANADKGFSGSGRRKMGGGR